MTTYIPTAAMWAPGHDQFGRPCWKHKETLQLYYEPSEQFAAQPQRSFGYGPNPNVPAGPRFTPVAEPVMEAFSKRSFGYRPNPNAPAGPRFTPVAQPGMEAFPKRNSGYRPNPNVPAGPRFTPVAEPGMEAFSPRRANPHAPSGMNQGGDGMANFSPAVNVWTPGYDQFGRPCWQNRETLKLHYDPSGQSPACPPMTLGDPSKASSTNKKDAASLSASPTPKTSSPLRTGRAKEAEQWSLKQNTQGVQLYVNSTTKKSQFHTPDCLKKYSTR